MLPFIRDRSLYDYDKQRWISVQWMSFIRTESRQAQKVFVTSDDKIEDSITDELNPITKSKFMIFAPLMAVVCGILALLPDISHLWGYASLDKSRFADLFFFHYSIDLQFAQNGFLLMNGVMLEFLFLITAVSLLVCCMAISQDIQYNRHNYENYTI